MKKLVFAAALALVAKTVSAYTASERDYHPLRVFIGPEYNYRWWHFNSGIILKQNMWGGSLGIEYFRPCSIYSRLIGTYQAGNTVSHTWVDHEYFAEANLGYTIPIDACKAFTVTPFFGFGYFNDRENLNAAAPYHVNYCYVPFGALLNWDINCDWSLGIRGQADVMVSRNIKLGAVGGTMGKRTNWRVELPVSYNFTQCFDATLIPFYQYDPNTNYVFPVGFQSSDWGRIQSTGARLEIGYHF